MYIAVIGAGLAGLTCARKLHDEGHCVTVYERDPEVGGRMSTRQTELGGFDHGAQYFTASTPEFRKMVDAWKKQDWVAPWQGKLVTLENGKSAPAGQGEASARQRWVAVPGMGALGQHLAEGLDVRTGHAARRIERDERGWLISVRAETVPVDATAGPFDAVITAVPADLAFPLLKPLTGLADEADLARLAPCWALILGFQEALGLAYDGAWVQGSRLRWIARDTSKPLRRPGEHWIAHAPPEWSMEHLDDDPERVKEKLLKAFHEATGTHMQPVYAAVHRWRFAQASSTLPRDCLWDENARVGACGDWFAAGLDGSGRVENAFLSGLAMAGCISAA
jgi:renalase